MTGMMVKVHRWPLLSIDKDKRYIRTKLPTATFDVWADIGPRGLLHVRMPGLMGVYDFRLSTGRATVEALKDYVVRAEDLSSLRVLREKEKAAEKA